jgi:2-polyprenyl-6-methoxyphenol hydroxylase-like FAD-dependent oxidoreductase
VIGADGLHSKVRRIGFASDAMQESYLGYHVAAFEATGYRPRDELAYVSFARPGWQIARFATRNDHTLFMMIFAAPQPIEACDGEAQRAVLRGIFGNQGWECDSILAAMARADSLYFDRVSQVHLPRWSNGRVALLGDAAHCPSLLAGEGCGLAIIDAYVLAGELARTPNDHASAFQAYERRLRSFVELKQRAARQFAGQFAPRTAFGIRLRNWATRAMAIPGVTQLLIGRALRDNIDLPNY